MKRIYQILFIVSVLSVINSCQDSVTSPIDENGIKTIDNLEIISKENVDNLVLNYDPATGELQFKDNSLNKGSASNDFIENNPGNGILELEDYIIIPPSDKVPTGCLKKITEIKDEGEILKISTQYAALDEIIDGEFEGSYTYAAEDVDSVFIYEQDSKKLYKANDYDIFSLPIDYQYIPFAKDLTRDDYVNITGIIKLSLGVDFSIDTDLNIDAGLSGISVERNLKHLAIALRVENTNNIRVEYGGNLENLKLPSIKIAEYKLKPIEFSIYGVPVYITNTVPVSINFSNYITANETIIVEIGRSESFRIGVNYSNNETALINEFSQSEDPLIKVSNMENKLGMKVGAEIDFESKLYDAIGPFIGAEVYGEVVANYINNVTPPRIDYDKKVGIAGHVGVDMGFMNFHIFKYDKDFLVWEKRL